MRFSRIGALVLVLALGLSAPALGQSAGDDQYQDPYAGGVEEPTGDTGAAPDEGDNTKSATPPQESAAAPATAAPSTAGAPAVASARGNELPRTGAEPLLLALGGSCFLGMGLALRRRLGSAWKQ